MKRLKQYKDSDKAKAYRYRHRKKNYEKGAGDPKVSGVCWTKQEEILALEHKMTDRELSKKIGRSVRAIQAKRYKMKRKLENEVSKETSCN